MYKYLRTRYTFYVAHCVESTMIRHRYALALIILTDTQHVVTNTKGM